VPQLQSPPEDEEHGGDPTPGRKLLKGSTASAAIRISIRDPHPTNKYLPRRPRGLLGTFQRIVNFDSEVADCALKLDVAEEQLYHSQVLCSSIDQGRLRSPQCVRAVGASVKPISRIQPPTMRAYCRVDRCGDAWSRLGNK
jgi:hypothetical protein